MANTRKAAGARPAPPLTFAQVRSRIQRPRRVAELVLDAGAAAEIDALELLLGRATLHDEVHGTATARQVAQSLQEAEEAAEASRVRLVFQAVSHVAYQELRAAHPPTARQIEQATKDNEGIPAFDPDTFAPALVAAQLVEPAPDPAEFEQFWAELSDGQLNHLWTTAMAVQLRINEVGPPSAAAAQVLTAFGLPVT